MTTRKLRGHAALTLAKGNAGVGCHIYRGQIIDPRDLDPEDTERLVREEYLQWVTPDGEGWKLAEDTADADKGEPVSVGTAGSLGPVEPGAAPAKVAADVPETDLEESARRQEAKSKLPADGSAPHHNASDAVWVEYAVAKGMDRGEAEKAGKKELQAALK